MPRANCYFQSGCLCHITRCCHEREFLLKFARNQHCCVGWHFEAKKRFGPAGVTGLRPSEKVIARRYGLSQESR